MTKEEMIQNGMAAIFSNQAEVKPMGFKDFAIQRHLTGKWNALKEPLYTKNHKQGDLAGQAEPVQGVRFETEHDGVKGFILLALSRNATEKGIQNLMQNPASLQVRIDQFNGYENLTLCTGQSDREVSEVGGTFTF